MLKSIFLLLLYSIGSDNINTEPETCQSSNNTTSFILTFDKSLDKNDSSKVLAKKNVLYFQVMGDTPYLGAGYSRRIVIKPSLLLETGVGFGFTPVFFNNRIPEPKKLSYSHHIRMVFRPQKLLSPTMAYSGVLISSDFYKDKIYNYWPSPLLGLRIGNSNNFAINLNWCGYFYKESFIQLLNDDVVQNGNKSKLLGLPSANIQFSF